MQTQTTTEYRNLSLNHRLVTQLLIAESVSGGARSLVQAHLLMPDAPESFVMQSALCHKAWSSRCTGCAGGRRYATCETTSHSFMGFT